MPQLAIAESNETEVKRKERKGSRNIRYGNARLKLAYGLIFRESVEQTSAADSVAVITTPGDRFNASDAMSQGRETRADTSSVICDDALAKRLYEKKMGRYDFQLLPGCQGAKIIYFASEGGSTTYRRRLICVIIYQRTVRSSAQIRPSDP